MPINKEVSIQLCSESKGWYMAPFKNKIGSSLVWVTPCEDVRMLVHIQLQNCIKFKYSAEMQSSILDEAGSADNRSSTGYLHYLVKRRKKKKKSYTWPLTLEVLTLTLYQQPFWQPSLYKNVNYEAFVVVGELWWGISVLLV